MFYAAATKMVTGERRSHIVPKHHVRPVEYPVHEYRDRVTNAVRICLKKGGL